LLWIAPGTPALGHGPIDDTLRRTTRDLAERPLDANLWLQRAELHRVHGDVEAAAKDLERASALAPEQLELDYHRGRQLLDRNEFELAEKAFARFLQKVPDHVAGHSLHAEALLGIGRRREAADALARAISIRPSSGLYLARARTLADAGEAEMALRTLDRAAETLGPVPSLGHYAIDLELAESRFDAALNRLDRLHAGATRRDSWLMERATILERAGRSEQAHASYTAVLAVISDLPSSRRSAPATLSLESLAREGVARLSKEGE
jgi:tetratricopeptide (TPR) repeat protein